MPLAIDAKDRIRANLTELSLGNRAPMITIGTFTLAQFAEVNRIRIELELHPLELNEILFIGKHLYKSRSADLYTVEDMVAQVEAALSVDSAVQMDRLMSCLQSTVGREDGYGNIVHDRAVFEMTAKKPRAELFSVIPKGDALRPQPKK